MTKPAVLEAAPRRERPIHVWLHDVSTTQKFMDFYLEDSSVPGLKKVVRVEAGKTKKRSDPKAAKHALREVIADELTYDEAIAFVRKTMDRYISENPSIKQGGLLGDGNFFGGELGIR